MNVIQSINTPIRTVLLTVTALLPLAFSAGASARDYKVEVLLFENNTPSAATESHDYIAPKAMRSEATTWALDASMLLDDAEALRESTDYELLHHFSWGQESLPYRESATYTVIERDTQGYIKVYADQLLFVNIDLDYQGFRMQEKRRLKLDEHHFFDHPKFGLILRVSRLEQEEELEGDELSDELTSELETAR